MQTTTTQEIMSDLIDLPEAQMRRNIDRDELHVLAENIKANGLISPLTVRPICRDKKTGAKSVHQNAKCDVPAHEQRFELVAGQRRLLALRIAGIIRIPCIVRTLDDITASNIMAAENLERRDVDLVDESNFIQRVMTEGCNTIEQMAGRLKRSEKYVADRLAVAAMPDYMQAYLKTNELKLGAALLLMQIEPDDKRRLWVGLAVQNNETVRGVEYWVYQHKLGTLPSAVNSESDIPGAPPSEYKPVMFRCAVDGNEYPATECQSVFVYKGNISLLDRFREEMGRAPAVVSVGGAENPMPTAVAAAG